MGGLARYLLVRALAIIPTILILYTVVFIILRVIPGDPILAVLGTKNIPPEQLENLRKMAGLDKPLYIQYFSYLFNVLRGNFGVTITFPSGVPISTYIAQRFPATFELAISGFIVSIIIGLGTGALAAVKRGSKIDKAMKFYSIIAYVTFIPLLGMVLQYIFGVYLKWLPIAQRIDPGLAPKTITGLYVLDSILTANWTALKSSIMHLILPSITLGVVLSGAYTRLLRNNMVEVLSSDFIRNYYSRGIKERKIFLYALKNAFLPVVTYMGLQFAILLGGMVLTESTFSWPGMGTFIVERLDYRDYTSIQAAIIFFAFIVGLISLIVDAIYALLDPRIRY